MSIRLLSQVAMGVVAVLAIGSQPAAAQHWGCGLDGYSAYPVYGYAAPAPVSVAVYSVPVVAYQPAYVVPVRAYPVAAYAPVVPVYRTAYVAPLSVTRYSGYGGLGGYRGVGHYHHRLRQIEEIEIKANRYGGYDVEVDYD